MPSLNPVFIHLDKKYNYSTCPKSGHIVSHIRAQWISSGSGNECGKGCELFRRW